MAVCGQELHKIHPNLSTSDHLHSEEKRRYLNTRDASFAVAGADERRAAAALRPFQVGGEKKENRYPVCSEAFQKATSCSLCRGRIAFSAVSS